MTEALRAYLLSIVAAALLTSILLALTPKGPVHRALSFLSGIVLILTALGPAARLDLDAIAESLSGLRIGSMQAFPENDEQDLLAAIIKEDAESYIWDKAAAVGFTPSEVAVEVRSGETYPYPYAAEVHGSYTEAQRRRVSALLEAELAIPAERQTWRTEEAE